MEATICGILEILFVWKETACKDFPTASTTIELNPHPHVGNPKEEARMAAKEERTTGIKQTDKKKTENQTLMNLNKNTLQHR